MFGNHKLYKCVEDCTSFLLQNNCVKCNNILYVVIRFIWKLYPNNLILSMVSPEIDIIRTPPYYIWTIVNNAIGNRSLLKVSNWLDYLKCVCLDGIVLIVFVSYQNFRSLAVIPLLKALTLPHLSWISLICSYFHCPTLNHWLQLYYVVLAQPFHSSPFSVHHSPSTVAPILSIVSLQL